MDDFHAEAHNATNQAYWFDTEDTDADGLFDAWEILAAGNLTALGARGVVAGVAVTERTL